MAYKFVQYVIVLDPKGNITFKYPVIRRKGNLFHIHVQVLGYFLGDLADQSHIINTGKMDISPELLLR